MINHYQRGKASVIIDGQFGSTGKGLIAAWIASQPDSRWVIHSTNAAPNAGHTSRWADGRKLTLYHLPTGGVVRNNACILNAGSIINLNVLREEVKTVREFHPDKPIAISVHPEAGIVTQEDIDYENADNSAATKISSTRKGVGRALARKIMREAKLARDYDKEFNSMGVNISHGEFAWKDDSVPLSIEVPQGVGLSLNNGGFYPYCTSREISVSQALSDAGVHPSRLGNTIMSVRTYPIRVGNLDGGTSGPAYRQQAEIKWNTLPVLTPELTTVTKRPRRIFEWSSDQYRHSLRICRPDHVFLNFINYYKDIDLLDMRLKSMERDEIQILGYKTDKIYGMGPNIEDIYEDLEEAYDRLASILHERT